MRRSFSAGLFMGLKLIWILNSHSQPVLRAIWVNPAPHIDGKLQEEAWQKAAVISEFYQREPNPGQPISEATQVYVCHDQQQIYFGFQCFDQPGGITAKEMARDVSLGEDDRVQVILDTFLDGRNGYWFQIGPRGSIGDALVSANGATFNKEWDGLWEGKARIHDQGWDAEIAIPFKTLTFDPQRHDWGLKLIRHIRRKLESSYWPAANLNSYRFQISDSGVLQGLEGITQGIGLDVSPYGLAGLDQKLPKDDQLVKDAGLDIFYQVTPGLKSALTVNTDFAQTEVDARQVNLTRFPLHFPEKRDFFLDGANYFDFGISGDGANPYSKRLIPFFSRRLGLDGNGNPIHIIWGAKFTGQIDRWNLGFLHIMDERDGENRNFTILRASANIASQSSIGFIGSKGNALSAGDNSVVGVDVKLASASFLGNKNIALILFGLKSDTDGLKGADQATGCALAYPNDLFSLRVGFHQIEKNFRAGVGFVPRTDIRESYFESTFGPRPNRWGLLQVLFSTGIDYITDLGDHLQTRSLSLTPLHLRFKTGDAVVFSFSRQYENLPTTFAIHPQHTIHSGVYKFARSSVSLQSAQRRNFWLTSSFRWGSFYNGERQDWTAAFGYKVSVPLYVSVEIERDNITLPDGDFIVDVGRLSLNLLFSPDITLYNYVQYDNQSKRMGWQSRFRWILTPGNEILLVWNSIWQDPLQRHEVTESATRLKVGYNYRF